MDRTYITLNENWKFHYGEVPEGWYKGYDDSAWTSVTLPHDWSVHMPFEQTNSSGTRIFERRHWLVSRAFFTSRSI